MKVELGMFVEKVKLFAETLLELKEERDHLREKSKQQIEDNGWKKEDARSQDEEMEVDEEEPQLLVTMPEGRTLTLYIGLQHTVMDAKIKIQDKSGVPQGI